LLDETTLPDVTRCGVNAPSPDILTPQRSASTIWTWAPGHPFTPQVRGRAALGFRVKYRVDARLHRTACATISPVFGG